MRWFCPNDAFKAKIASLEAKDVDQVTISVFMEFPRDKTSVFGKIYFLAAPIGGKDMTFDDLTENKETKVYDLRRVPQRVNIDLPKVNPWEKHLTAISVNDWGVHVAVEVDGRVLSIIGEDDIFLKIKGEYEFSGVFVTPK